MRPSNQPWWQPTEDLVLLGLTVSITISAGQSVFYCNLLIKSLFERGLSATKFKCCKLLLNI